MIDYQSLKSGTDVRGCAMGEKAVLTREAALCIGGAFITWLTEKTGKNPGQLTVAIGRDSRITGPELLAACAYINPFSGAHTTQFASSGWKRRSSGTYASDGLLSLTGHTAHRIYRNISVLSPSVRTPFRSRNGIS